MLLKIAAAARSSSLRRRVPAWFAAADVELSLSPSPAHLWRELKTGAVDLVLVEQSLLPTPAVDWIASVRALPEQPDVIVLSEKEDPHERATLIAAGCMAVLFYGLADPDLTMTLAALLVRRRDGALRNLSFTRSNQRHSLDDFVSSSPAMQQFVDVARRVVTSDSSLLILGETGVGKERLAAAIHEQGPRGRAPFIPINCGALPETLLESELFGHEEGAFTGATRTRRGHFELAHGGTVFLDEVGEMPHALQIRLLRVLETRKIQRVGGEKMLPVDVRIMAATNRDLDEEVRARRFRADLFYRLAVVTLTVPPLRERREDIPDLVRSYLEMFRSVLGRPARAVSDQAMEALVAYAWPGNVRELINVMERAVLLSTTDTVTLSDLPRVIRAGVTSEVRNSDHDASAKPAVAFARQAIHRPLREGRGELVAVFEREYLSSLLRETHGRIGDAARRAGVNERSLYELLKRHGLRKEDFKQGSAD